MDDSAIHGNDGDLSALGDLNEQTILTVIKNRFHKDQIYSWCGGDILIAVNPYKPLEIYGEQYHETYDWRKPKSREAPHIYATTIKAYQRLLETSTDQIVLISGESGAGKTESTKYVIKHLLKICESKFNSLQTKIIDANPLMEAFGNAQTTLNENSSRFAKFIEIKFNSAGGVAGAKIRDYLLEKSRVVHQAPKERNFHIFYYFLAGVSERLKEHLYLDQKSYRIIGQGQRKHPEAFRRKYEECLRIMKLVGLGQDDIQFVQTILAAILHIGEITFKQLGPIGVIVSNEKEMSYVASLLDIDVRKFGEALVSEKKSYAGEEIPTLKNEREAANGRDALAKALYERLFGWLITQINRSLQGNDPESLSTNLGAVGILDICGFEIMETNGIEQLCINLVNEQLQNFMNTQVFRQEKEIYESEGLRLDITEFPNNTEIIRMFNKPKDGILDLINEDTKLNQATNMSMINKIANRYSPPHFTPDPHSRPRFKIQHFAGRVEYDASLFREKNGDNLSKNLRECMLKSGDELICDLFTVEPANTGSVSTKPFDYRQSKKDRSPLKTFSNVTRNTVIELRQSTNKLQQRKVTADPPKDHKTALSYLKGSLQELLQKMKEAEPFFIRCIKPNVEQRPGYFMVKKVSEQLMYIGIKDIAEIRKLAYPLRRRYDDFLNRYSDIIPESKTIRNDQAACEMILQRFFKNGREYRLGKTQIFMFEIVRYTLEGILRLHHLRQSKLINRCVQKWKEVVLRKKLDHENKTVKRVQRKSSVRFENIDEMTPTTNASETESLCDDKIAGGDDSSDKDADVEDNLDESSDKQDEDQQEEDDLDDDSPSWDQFQMFSPESQTTDMNNGRILRFLKIFIYCFLFILLLGSSVVQKLSLANTISTFNITLVKAVKDKYPEKVKKFAFLIMSCVLAICVPYVLNVLTGALKIMFGKFQKPSIKTCIVVLIMETLHSFGLCILLFFVLPCFEDVIVVCLLCAVASLPAILLLVSATDKANKSQSIACSSEKTAGKIICYIMDVSSCFLQFSVIALMVILPKRHYVSNVTGGDNILFAAGFILVSFGWWENFLDDRFFCSTNSSLNNRITQFFLCVRYEQQEGRYYTSVLANFLKIGITILMTYIHTKVFKYEETLVNLKGIILEHNDPELLIPVISLNLCGIVLWYTGYIACKLNMQTVSFSLPLLLATPVSVLILCLRCNGIPEKNYLLNYICDNWETQNQSYYFLVGIGWYLSLLWITRHIWFPKQERLAKYGRLFVNPLYCGILPVENCMLNRRRHARKIKVSESIKDGKVCGKTYRLSNSDNKDDDDFDDSFSSNSQNESKEDLEIPLIYACATMWHETRIEMLQLLKSLHRIDADQYMRRNAQEFSKSRDPDFYNYEAHIFFDDAMEMNDDDEWQVNDFVAMLVECMEEAVSSVYNASIIPHPPTKIPTPYGGRLLYEMPGGNNLYIHLKDKNKIRHRKRWSQVMYMYYLLGYNLLHDCEEKTLEDFKDEEKRKQRNWKSSDDLTEHLSEEVLLKSQNTFILALDGDTDFSPVAVRILLDRMKKNEKAGAACGRIHPIGSGPLVWYQKFEYAVGHWLQKATEHVFGCVLCSPGCFSLFRGSALMDKNVMRKYTILPSKPSHYLQFDQGEDRWLCTLLLQQGYRVDYAAAADAFTYAPEGFNEFFNQRRRWMPSTMANIMDLLDSAKQTVTINNNISMLYIVYQASLMISTILGPATVLMMIAASFQAVFRLELVYCYLASLGPTAVFVIICLKTKANTQLLAAAILSTIYAFVMVMVFAGTLITAVKTTIFDPSVIFLVVLIFVFVVAGLLHPYEIGCLPAGALYFICIPSGYLLLVIYSFANLDNVSWGTREIPKKKTKAELAAEAKAAAEKKKEGGFFSRLFCNRGIIDDFKEVIRSFSPSGSKNDSLLREIKHMNRNLEKVLKNQNDFSDTDSSLTDVKVVMEKHESEPEELESEEEEIRRKKLRLKVKRDDLKNPYWIEDKRVLSGQIAELHQKELKFWKDFIRKYLKPLDKDPEKEKIVKNSLKELRTNVMFLMCMVNLLWIGVNFMFQISKTQATTFSITYEDIDGNEKELKVEILGLLFIFFFALVLVLQLFGMVLHRWGTLLHITSITELKPLKQSTSPFEETFQRYKQTMVHQHALISDNVIRSSAPRMENNIPITRTTFKKPSDIFQPKAGFEVSQTPNNWRQSRLGLSQQKRGLQLRLTNKNIIKRAKHELSIPLEDPEPDYEEEPEVEDSLYDFMKQKENETTMSKFMYRTQTYKTHHYRPSLRVSHRFMNRV